MRTGPFLVFLAIPFSTQAQTAEPLAARIQAVMARPEYRHASFGVEVYSLTERKVLYAHNADKLFVPGSVTKLLTEGTALQLLGPEHRFRTRVYCTGPISPAGVLEGDVVLLASGDPNLSNRLRPDGTLAFENVDHSYGQVMEATLVPGDPLQVVRSLAAQVAARGVKKVTGRVLVDVTLFPEGAKEGGTGVVVSPIAVNDNVIDVVVTPGKSPGDTATVEAVPATTYATFESEVKTGPEGGEAEIGFVPAAAPNDTLRVTVRGIVPAGTSARPFPFAVPRPSRFAQAVFVESLRGAGVEVAQAPADAPDWKALARSYVAENQLAEHVSAPLAEAVKVTLKVSQNLHAAMMPYLLGAVLDDAHDEALDKGFARERAFLEKAGLDTTAAAQSDGAGGDACFTPDFLVRFLAFMAEGKDAAAFREALPVLGRDGTLWHTAQGSPAAGKLRAKTGTHAKGDLLNQQYFINGKALAGYLDAKDGARLAVAVLANNVPIGADIKAITRVGDAVAEIAAAAYDAR
jgi:D-alanyl-D-alanine carboxypeptidase/D-alanyl-D-alanine-endopeptidase (penicillin-binding protein 4)